MSFPVPNTVEDSKAEAAPSKSATGSSTKRRASQSTARKVSIDSNEFNDDTLEDAELAHVEGDGFVDIDDFDDNGELRGQPQKKKQKSKAAQAESDDWEPRQLSNGKWTCRHTCADKTTCRHLCCREGSDKKPKPAKQKESKKSTNTGPDPKQTQLKMPTAKKSGPSASKKTTSDSNTARTQRKTVDLEETRDLHRLHNSVASKHTKIPVLRGGQTHKGDVWPKAGAIQANVRGVSKTQDGAEAATSDYGLHSLDSDDLPEIEDIRGHSNGLPYESSVATKDTSFDFSMFDQMDADIDFSDVPNKNNGRSDMGSIGEIRGQGIWRRRHDRQR